MRCAAPPPTAAPARAPPRSWKIFSTRLILYASPGDYARAAGEVFILAGTLLLLTAGVGRLAVRCARARGRRVVAAAATVDAAAAAARAARAAGRRTGGGR